MHNWKSNLGPLNNYIRLMPELQKKKQLLILMFTVIVGLV